MAENDFVVNFGTDDFQVVFGEQGPQGPASAATPFVLNDTYEQGDIVFDTSGNLFGSRINDNTGNPLSDTDSWVALGIASGVVTQLDDLTDVTIDTPSINQGLIYDGSLWVNKAIPNTTPINPSQVKITLMASPDEVILGTGDTAVEVSIGLSAGYSFSSANWEVKDQDNHDLLFTVSGGSIDFTVDNTERGHITVHSTVFYTRNTDSSPGSESSTIVIPVEEQFFSEVSSTQPTTIATMMNEGVWSSPKELTFTTGGTDTHKLYIALPTDRAPYVFTSGIAYFAFTDITTINSDYTLYSVDDYDDTPAFRTFIVDIAEE